MRRDPAPPLRALALCALALLPAAPLAGSSPDPAGSQSPGAPAVPGAEHELLAGLVGTWEAVRAGPDGAPVPTGTTKTVSGTTPYHVASDIAGRMMGLDFTAHVVDGYCTIEREFFRVHVDSMSPSPMVLRGGWDPETRALTLRGTCTGPGGRFVDVVARTVLEGPDRHVETLHAVAQDGTQTPIASLVFARRTPETDERSDER